MATDKPTAQGNGDSPFNRTAQHDAKREAILSQAAKLFNGRGFRATTLLDIAQSLGLTKTSLYYYVKTKEDLIYQCYIAALEHLNRGLDVIEQQHSTGLHRVQAMLRSHFIDYRLAQDGKRNHTAALLEIASLKDQNRTEVEQRYTQLFLRLRQFIRDGIKEGSIRPCESSATTLGLLGSMQWSFEWLRTLPGEQLDAMIDGSIDLITHGLSSQPGPYAYSNFSFGSEQPLAAQGFDRAEQNRMKQDAFYKTGTWFFNKKGFNGTSLDEIAETLNVTKGAFYYHIRNKEDLLYNCYTRSLDIGTRIHDTAARQGSGITALEYLCRDNLHVQNSDAGPLIRYNTITALPTDRRKEILQLTAQSNRRFSEHLKRGIEDGSMRAVNVDVAVHLISGAINASMDLPLWRKMDDVDQASRDYCDLFFNGLKPRQSE